jgi:hypothetical protein
MHCGHCNTDLPAGMRADARYCSDPCRLAAVTERRRAQRKPRKCVECGEEHGGRAKLCADCRGAEYSRPEPHDALLSRYTDYCDKVDKLRQEYEAKMLAIALGHGADDIIYRWISTNTGPLSRHERRSLRAEGAYGRSDAGWSFKITNDTDKRAKALGKYVDNPEIIARLDEIAARQKQLRRGLRPGSRGPYRFAT